MNRLATIFSLVTTAGILLAAVSGVAWIVAAVRHRETTAKTLCIAGIIVTVVGFVLFLRSYDSSLHQEREPQAPTAQAPTAQEETPKQTQKPAQEPVSAASGDQQGNAPTSPQTPTETQQEPIEESHSNSEQEPLETEEQLVPAAENPLFSIGVQEHPVMNGFKTERIGTWACIYVYKDFMSTVTSQQLYDYLTELESNNYNWFNIFFEDGTGLWTFSPTFVEYGVADQDEGGSVEYIGEPEDCIYTFIDGQYTTGD